MNIWSKVSHRSGVSCLSLGCMGGKREGGLLPKTFQIYCSKAVVHLKIRNFKRTEIDE